ncbi:MAG: nucleotide-binding universal stress UspA family protein [Sphingobacteriales bacterium]|jgi:nucleotide-binding universal stress UspA family protein
MSTPKTKILVPTDFSENANKALEEAIFFAKHFNSEIVLLHVIENYLINATLSKAIGFNKERNESLKMVIEEQLSEMAEELSKKENVTISWETTFGKSYKEIVQKSEDLDVDFIIMGTHGANGMEKFMVGTNASRVASIAKKPVITIQGKADLSNFSNLVLPLDLTKETRGKVNKAVELAKSFNATIHVVAIQTTSDEFLTKKLNLQMNQVINHIVEKNINVTSKVLEAENVAQEIVNYAQSFSNSALIIMTQQEMGLTDYILGSEANRIIKNAEIPVVSIRPKVTGKVVFRPY